MYAVLSTDYVRYTALYRVCYLFLPTVRQLHREFLRAGADVMQTFTFYASDDKLQNRGNTASEKIGVRPTTDLYLFNCENKLETKEN